MFEWKETRIGSHNMFEGYDAESCIEAWIGLTPEGEDDRAVKWHWESDEDSERGLVYIDDKGVGWAMNEAMQRVERSAELESRSWSNR